MEVREAAPVVGIGVDAPLPARTAPARSDEELMVGGEKDSCCAGRAAGI